MSNKTLKTAGICGIAAPIIAYACILAAIASYPPFSWTNNALSDLGVQPGITAIIFNFGLVISGLLFLAFAVNLFSLLGKHMLGRIGVAALALACVSLIAIGVFNESFNPIHFYVSVAFFVFLPISLMILAATLCFVGQRKLGVFTLAIAFVAATPWILQYTIGYVPNVAIPEFISGLAGATWTVILSYKMLKESSQQAPNLRFVKTT